MAGHDYNIYISHDSENKVSVTVNGRTIDGLNGVEVVAATNGYRVALSSTIVDKGEEKDTKSTRDKAVLDAVGYF